MHSQSGYDQGGRGLTIKLSVLELYINFNSIRASADVNLNETISVRILYNRSSVRIQFSSGQRVGGWILAKQS
jgi:hypothetical protein